MLGAAAGIGFGVVGVFCGGTLCFRRTEPQWDLGLVDVSFRELCATCWSVGKLLLLLPPYLLCGLSRSCL